MQHDISIQPISNNYLFKTPKNLPPCSFCCYTSGHSIPTKFLSLIGCSFVNANPVAARFPLILDLPSLISLPLPTYRHRKRVCEVSKGGGGVPASQRQHHKKVHRDPRPRKTQPSISFSYINISLTHVYRMLCYPDLSTTLHFFPLPRATSIDIAL